MPTRIRSFALAVACALLLAVAAPLIAAAQAAQTLAGVVTSVDPGKNFVITDAKKDVHTIYIEKTTTFKPRKPVVGDHVTVTGPPTGEGSYDAVTVTIHATPA